MSDELVMERWDASSDMTAEHIKFKLQFSMPKIFGTPVVTLVENHHPHEFQLVAFSLDLPNTVKDVHFWTSSWVENTGDSEGRIFFLDKVWINEYNLHPFEFSLHCTGFRLIAIM